MTTIILSEAIGRNDGLYQVFGTYEDGDGKFVFGVKDFAMLEQAEAHAMRQCDKFGVEDFVRVTK